MVADGGPGRSTATVGRTATPRGTTAGESGESAEAADGGAIAEERTVDPDPALELAGVAKEFATETAVADLDLTVREGELLTLVGPSGCGKTTTLRLLAGLERPDAGEVRLDGEPVAGSGRFVPPDDRDVGVVFQDFALFPHLTVRENVGFGLTGWAESRRRERVDDLLGLVGLSGYGDRNPDQLSGGQQQRVALARALAPRPSALLLDEPFSNLDAGLRAEMREEVRRIIKDAGVTAISVTHDQEEALSIGDRVAVMRDGHIEQVGVPAELFEGPESRFVAGFLGRASFLSGRITPERVETVVGDLPLDRLRGTAAAYEGAEVDVLVRPDDLRATPDTEDPDGEVIHREYSGPSFVHRVELENGDVVHCLHDHTEAYDVGTSVSIDLVADHPLAWYPA
jgi:iron(III) transport system ATP-binding protein